MNKDLDSRLIPNGEYRDAQNVSVSKSEGADVGSLENILGNISLTDFGLVGTDQLSIDIIGFFMDVNSDRIFLFLTNYVDTSGDRLSTFAPTASECHIACYNALTSNASIIVSGNFLNFSKPSPVLGVNLINDNLFFTDNRNQPRKINVSRALSNNTYYTSEDQISLAKYYPYEPISLIDTDVVNATIVNAGSGYTPTGQWVVNAATINSPDGAGLTLDILVGNGGGATSFNQTVASNFGYTLGSIVSTTPITSANGSGLTILIQTGSGGGIPSNIGSGYAVGDVVKLDVPVDRYQGPALVQAEFTVTATAASGTIGAVSLNSIGEGYTNGEIVTIDSYTSSTTNATVSLTVESTSTMKDVVSQTLPGGNYPNPLFNANWPGDSDFLKERFVRFAYRFKFDDGEYSLISPFTQECFVPEQDGYFIGDDEEKTFKSTEVDFMKNKINDIKLIIDRPAESANWGNATSDLNITAVEIIYKDSANGVLKLLDTIDSSFFNASTSTKLFYDYQSLKPYKTLPVEDLFRVYDQTPVRALAQDVIGNRVVYGNFLDKHTPPSFLEYNLKRGYKMDSSGPVPNNQYSEVRKEYQNHTLKQDRNYQVGVVLSDRYGRQSDVILSSSITNSQSITSKASTIFNPYKSGLNIQDSFVPGSFSYFYSDLNLKPSLEDPPEILLNDNDTWPGDQIKIEFTQAIQSVFNSSAGTPGLYSITNPTGWYSYKIVVKQDEIDYYNVYCPGVLSGYIDGETPNPLGASPEENIYHFALHSDNLSKIPKDTTIVGPNQNTFRTSRPSFNADPDYYQFTDTNGNLFQVDPYTEEGETLLKTRDRERDLDSGSQVQNASVKLATRVINYFPNSQMSDISDPQIRQYYPARKKEIVTTVGTGDDLGLFSVGGSVEFPYNTAPGFYNFQSNPFVARFSVYSINPNQGGYTEQDAIDVYGQPGPSPNAAEYEVEIVLPITAGGTDYPGTGGNGLPIVFKGTTDIDNNFKNKGMQVKFEASGGVVTDLTLVNSGEGWETIGLTDTVTSATAEATLAAAGNADCTFDIKVTRLGYGPDGGLLPIFSCFETEPLESKLDIYWETTTAGLISKLNTDIVTGDNITPYGFADNGSDGTVQTDTLTWLYPESYPQTKTLLNYGDEFSTNKGIFATNESGQPITMANGAAFEPTMTLLSATGGNGDNLTSTFTLAAASTPLTDGSVPYVLERNIYNPFSSTSAQNDVYFFTIRVNAPSASYPIDGTTVNTDLQLQLAPQLNLPQPAFPLTNVTPVVECFSTGPYTNGGANQACGGDFEIRSFGPNPYPTVPPGSGGFILASYLGSNGVNTSAATTEEQRDLTYTVTMEEIDAPPGSLPSNFFLTSPFMNGGNNVVGVEVYINPNSITTSTDVRIVVKATDGGGLIDKCTTDLFINQNP